MSTEGSEKLRFANFLSEFLDFAKRDESGNIVLPGGVTDAAATLDVEELALFSVIDLIASAGSLCEWRTYRNDKRTRGEDWYSWNISPNQNQNAVEFRRLLLARLLRFNEALVFSRNGEYFLADSFCRETYAFRPNVYSGITCGNLTLSYTLMEPDVFYFRLANQHAAALLGNLRRLYSRAMEEAWNKYQNSGGRSGILKISAQASGRKTFETDLEKLMNQRFKTFFEKKNAVLPLLDGYDYIPQNGPSVQKSTSEVSDMESLIRQAQDRACNAYHVPPSILRGDVSSLEDAVNSMLSFGVKPTLSIIQTEVNRKSYGKAVLDGWYLRIDTTHIKTVDVFAVAEKVDKLIQDSVYNPNDIREKLDDEVIPEKWANEYVRTKNVESALTGQKGE